MLVPALLVRSPILSPRMAHRVWPWLLQLPPELRLIPVPEGAPVVLLCTTEEAASCSPHSLSSRPHGCGMAGDGTLGHPRSVCKRFCSVQGSFKPRGEGVGSPADPPKGGRRTPV